MKIFFRIVGILFAIIFSIPLFALLVATPVYTSLVGVVDADTIGTTINEVVDTTIEQIDFQDVLLQMEDDEGQPAMSEEEAEQMGTLIESFLSSDAAEELINSYSADLANILTGDETAVKQFTPEKLAQIVDNNMDELMTIVEELVPEEEMPEDKEEIKTAVKEMVNDFAGEMMESLPTPEDVATNSELQELQQTIQIITNPVITTVLYAAIGIFAALVFVCLLKTGGFIGLAINGILASLPLFVIGSLENLSLPAELLPKEIPFEMFRGAIHVLTAPIKTAAIIMLLVSFVFIGLFILFAVLRSKKKKALAAANEAPLFEIAQEEVQNAGEITDILNETPAEETVIEETQAEN
ncbi:MAG: hypothetical protein IJC85_03205 [Oscillospiraceae bacterium]|nr:hypothetical protein [Oscillospiraceae bacterium]